VVDQADLDGSTARLPRRNAKMLLRDADEIDLRDYNLVDCPCMMVAARLRRDDCPRAMGKSFERISRSDRIHYALSDCQRRDDLAHRTRRGRQPRWSAGSPIRSIRGNIDDHCCGQ
jgi:hypothetical protein